MPSKTLAITQALKEAESWIGEYWPLQGAVATNPLSGRVHESFLTTAEHLQKQGIASTFPLSFYYQAYRTGKISQAALNHATHLAQLSQQQTGWILSQATSANPESFNFPSPLLLVSERIPYHKKGQAQRWVLQNCTEHLAHYFDQGEAVWRPNANNPLLIFWEEHTTSPIQSLAYYLNSLAIDPQHYALYFTRILFYLRGYASLIQWLKTHPENPWVKANADLTTLILMWLHYEAKLFTQHKGSLKATQINEPSLPPVGLSPATLHYVWQTAYEWTEHQRLLDRLQHHFKSPRTHNPSAQFVFCMDPRSEGFRRHLEQHASFETFAAAGFFGFPFNINNEQKSACQWQAPGLLQAKAHVTCAIGMNKPQTFKEPLKKMQQNPLSAFGLIEWANLLPAFKLLSKQYAPGLYQRLTGTKNKKHLPVKLADSSFDISAATQAAYGFLTSIGLTSNFAPFIFICGHEAAADNNPLLSSLQCGACGANSGQPNAELAASALNHPEVRAGLSALGPSIPESTRFIAACHHTTTDELTYTNAPETESFKSIHALIQRAGNSLRQERLQAWPSQGSSVWRKAKDWSELLPELGLANHTALIIGPRPYTRGLNLDRRVFLHDYNASQDPSGEILQNILLGPGVVAQWINSYYYFSTVAPDHFGGGKKTLHNLTGNIGVVEGNGGDLKIGLPEESLRFQNLLLHEPRRLLWVIYAPKTRVNAIIERHPILKQLIEGQWIWLQVMEEESVNVL